ncbi:terpene synthase family protein [Nocardia otitidiscaviarum]|uniref:terpene synthase family protein n=1 Tax=Nocardia otitidiscaviarum TaxID=1823 RepID=UPI0024552411|nr:terpene synthase family protein [Nocardia otitidiscaviarum]
MSSDNLVARTVSLPHPRIEIPPIWCPLDLHQHSGGIEFQRRSEDFYRRMGFDATSLALAHDMCTGELACMWAPEGDAVGIQLLSDWLMWALLFDDHYCDDGPISRNPTRFNHVAAGLMNYSLHPEREALGIPDFDAFAVSLADIMARVRQRAGAEPAMLCALSHYRWALGAACGVSDRSGRYLRSLDEHLIERPPDGGDLLSVHLIEVAESTWLDLATRSTPAVRAATDAATVLLTVPTDLASFARERDQHSLESNIVEIIAVHDDCTRQEAVYRACALIEEIMELFLALKNKLSATGTPELCRYLEQLSNMIRGTLEWQRRLPRYAKSFNGADRARLREDPLHGIADRRVFVRTEPPPAIRWWWSLV